MRLVYAPRAIRDLRHIGAYLLKYNTSGARRTLGEIKATLEILAEFPRIGRLIDAAGRRRIPVIRRPYAIYYRIDRDDVLVPHIRHTARKHIEPKRDL